MIRVWRNLQGFSPIRVLEERTLKKIKNNEK